MSNDSSYTLDVHQMNRSILDDREVELGDSAYIRDLDWKAKLQAGFAVQRDDLNLFESAHQSHMRYFPSELRPKNVTDLKKENRKLVAALIGARAKQEAVRDLIAQCRHTVALGALSSKYLAKRCLITAFMRVYIFSEQYSNYLNRLLLAVHDELILQSVPVLMDQGSH